MHDIIIIGGGPAGLSASIYTRRFGLSTLLIEKIGIGGQAALTDLVENYPGFPEGIKGPELVNKMEEQAKKFDVEFLIDEVLSLNINSEIKKIKTSSSILESKGIIIATGASPKKLEIPGEREFTGKGVSYCAICDAFFYKNKDVLVVGGGDSAITEALYLTTFANKVYIIHRRDKLRAAKLLQERAFKNEKIEFILNSIVKEIKGEKRVERVVIQNIKEDKTYELNINGIFIYVGLIPNSGFLNGEVALDEKGFIITDDDMRTNKKFIYAAGDVRKKTLRQIITSCSDGAIAANTFYTDLNG